MIEQEYPAKTFVTWKWRWMGFNWMNRGTDFWQLVLGFVLISRMPGESKSVKVWHESKRLGVTYEAAERIVELEDAVQRLFDRVINLEQERNR